MQQLENAPCFCFCTSDNGTLLDVNETLCSGLGFLKNELIGKKAEIIFTVSTRIFYQTHLFPLLQMQHYAYEIFIILQTKTNEQIPVLLNAEKKMLNDKTVMVYVGIVVSNRKKFEDELIAAKKEAELALKENTALNDAKQQLQQHLEKLEEQMHVVKKQNEELQQFNHAVTHDLQEPLRKLLVFSDIILQDDDKKNQQNIIKRFLRVLEHMRSVLSGLQQYIWLTRDVNKFNSIDLNVVICDAELQLKKDFSNADFNIQKQILPLVYADKEQIQLLFYHLLSNAIKFRKPGSAAQIEISANELLQNKFRNIKDKYQYTGFIKIEITDKGPGFNAKYKEHVFELFKRLHKESGIGIGLALCKKIADNHHGNISIESKENEGTTVTVLLPANNEYHN
jgi:phosphoserine phosphatase RsbU/P